MRYLQYICATFFRRSTIVILLLTIACAGTRDLRAPSGGAGTLVVAVDAARPLPEAVAGVESLGYAVHRSLADVHALEVSGSLDDASVRRIEALPGVRYAEPIASVRAADMPPDPLFGDQYPYLSVVNAPAAWDISKGSASVVVAVVDTGVDVRHPNLAPNIWVNPNEIANNGVDDDNNG